MNRYEPLATACRPAWMNPTYRMVTPDEAFHMRVRMRLGLDPAQEDEPETLQYVSELVRERDRLQARNRVLEDRLARVRAEVGR